MLTDWVHGRRQPDRDAARHAARRPARPQRPCGDHRSQRATCRSTPARGPAPASSDETIQFHGTADRYTLTGAHAPSRRSTRTPTTATGEPGRDAARRRRRRRPGGGVHLRPRALGRLHAPGQPGLGRRRSATAAPPVRSDDLFFGRPGLQPDWVDLDKVAIPQADEQQRLLANLITQMNLDRTPLPRFWYLPRGEKAAVVHDRRRPRATAGPPARFDD